jgi:mRNA interferase MazF
MGRFIKGDVVVLPFPYTDLSGAKPRPALVVAPLTGDDALFCMITGRSRADGYSVQLSLTDFQNGSLPHDSVIRPNRLFTGDENIVTRLAGQITDQKKDEVIQKILDILS